MKRRGSSLDREFQGSGRHRSGEWEGEDPFGRMYDGDEEDVEEEEEFEDEEEEDEDELDDEEEEYDDDEEEDVEEEN